MTSLQSPIATRVLNQLSLQHALRIARLIEDQPKFLAAERLSYWLHDIAGLPAHVQADPLDDLSTSIFVHCHGHPRRILQLLDLDGIAYRQLHENTAAGLQYLSLSVRIDDQDVALVVSTRETHAQNPARRSQVPLTVV